MAAFLSPSRLDGILKDAVWWFEGFRAAQSQPTESDPTRGLSDSLRLAIKQIENLSLGWARLMGVSENSRAIAITEDEFSQIRHAFRKDATGEDVLEAYTLIQRIQSQFNEECRRAAVEGNMEVPF